jgi:predicted Zn-dependent protease
MLRKCITDLYNARHDTPQAQKELVIDIKRRGFLKQVIDVTLFGAFASHCCAAPSEYSGNLPDIGDSDRTTLSPVEANFLGLQVIQEIGAAGDMLNDYDVLTYLNDTGGNLVSFSSLAGAEFNFYIIKDKQINAFALPGGYICVYNGLIFTTRSEAELTSVMSHEIGHVVQHHIFRNIANYNRNQWLALAGVLAGGLLAAFNPAAAIVALNSGQGMAIQNMLSFSRDFEREADRVGQGIMYKAGFDPNAMPAFFQHLQDANKFNDSGAYEFLRTHPVTTARISEAENRARGLHVKMRPDSVSFLLIREKCRTRQLLAPAAILFYNQSIASKKYTSLDAQYYGLAYAYFVNQNFALSLASLAKISASNFISHPIVLSLKAQILIALKNYKLADKVFTDALDKYPTYKSLWIGQVDLYMGSKQYGIASKKLDTLGHTYPNDVDVWLRQTSLYADTGLNNKQKYFYALGNTFYINGDYKSAIEQYQKAILVKGGDQTLNDIISAKMLDTRGMIRYRAQFTS